MRPAFTVAAKGPICPIRGFISTAKKQGKNALEYLHKTFERFRVDAILLSGG